MAGAVMDKWSAERLEDERLVVRESLDEILKFYHYKPIEIPENIKDIPASAFSCDLYLQQYTRVVLHKDVRTIGGAAFIPQEGFLKEVVCYNENPPQLGDESFCSAELPFISLRVPADAVQRYREAAGWQEFGSISPIE